MVKASGNWRLALGNVEGLTEIGSNIIWRDCNIAFFSSRIGFSRSQRYVVVGDMRLSNSFQESSSELAQLVELNGNGSDLEAIAIAWETWGVETLSKLMGIFSLAVWDRDRTELWLGRDPVGGRTLYYTTTTSESNSDLNSGKGSMRWAASDLRSLRNDHSREIDPVALRDYLCCAFVPGSQTMWRNVKELRPGTVLSLPNEKHIPYWQVQESITEGDRPIAWHSDRLRALLDRVVQESLPSGESVGVFLSGGLDSSCVTALAAKSHSALVHTYSIHFGAKCPNELEFSSMVAKHCNTEHHILEITFRQMWEWLPETMRCLDDPIGDPLTVPNLLLGKLAAASVPVILNGEGGDPCFGGPKNQPMLIDRLYGGKSGLESSEDIERNSLQAFLLSFQKCFADLPQLLKPEIFASVKDRSYVFESDLTSNASYLNRLMALNIKFKGADQILTKVNNLTRAAGLHGRSPLFDRRVVDLSMQIPPQYKLSGVEEKAVLKQAVANLLPAQILQRPKSGMMVPVQMGFREHWNRQAKSLLLNRKAAIAAYLNQSLIKDWLDYRGDTWQRYGVKLWLLSSLEYWLQEN
jgi:asparagine synthase (glutamine-hydrolysing)